MPKQEFDSHSRFRTTSEVSAGTACVVRLLAMGGGAVAVIYFLPKIIDFLNSNINSIIKTLNP